MEIKSKLKEERKKIIRHKVNENTSNFLTGVVKKRDHFQNGMTKNTTLTRTSKKQIKATKLEQKFKSTGLESNDNVMKSTVTDSKWEVQDKSENKLLESRISENDRACEENWEIRWNKDNKLSGDSSGEQKAYGDENITKLTEESNPDRAADVIGKVLYTFYRRLKKGKEPYLPVIKTSRDCFRKLNPQVTGYNVR